MTLRRTFNFQSANDHFTAYIRRPEASVLDQLHTRARSVAGGI